MGNNEFYAKSIIFLLLLNFAFVSYPMQVNSLTGLETGDVSGVNASDTNVNGTTQVSDVGGISSSLSTIFTIYTSAKSENRILQAIFLIYSIIVVRDIVLDLGWIG